MTDTFAIVLNLAVAAFCGVVTVFHLQHERYGLATITAFPILLNIWLAIK